MHFERPPQPDSASSDDGTIILPSSSKNYPDELFTEVVSRPDARSATPELVRSLIEPKDGYYELNLEALARLVWEHRQYSKARKFSPAQIETLRELQIHSQNNERVLFGELVDSIDYTKQRVNQALSDLQDRGLVSKEGHGVYRYVGFEELTPAMEAEADTTTSE